MIGLVSYGGDPSVNVARAEIERITSSLAGVQSRLIHELQPMAQLNGLVHHLQLDAQLPETLVRLGLQRHGCFVAAESYFSTDARIAHQLSALAETVHAHPWLEKQIPKQVWAVMAVGVAASAFSNNDVTALATRTITSQYPLDGIGRFSGSLPESKIHLEEQPPSAVYQTPQSLEELGSRLHNPSGMIRVEAYQTNAGRVVVMYLPGTSEWNPLENEKAFDVRSDFELASAAEKSSSYRSANAAMNAFGVKGGDRVILVGYSQGGMVAAQLAQHHRNVIGMLTLGSPIAEQHLPKNLSVISLEHSNDLVPAACGRTNPLTENWATGTRHVDVAPGETILKAHSITEYEKTAALADSSTDAGLVRMRGKLLDPLANAQLLEVREYLALKGAS